MNFIDTLSESFRGDPASARDHASKSEPIRSRWPIHTEDEIAAVVDVLQSGRVNSLHHGDNCRAFEEAFAELCDAPYAISVANGTLGLELALRALEIGPGDEVIVTPRSFIASASCIVNCGATPVFADVDLHTQNITPETVEAVITERTRAVLAVHLAGYPCDMEGLVALASKHDFKIVEDCAQAHGATLNGRPVGSFGDAGVFSFCTDKIISTGGEGGMVALRDRDVWRRAWSFKDHGKDYDLTHEQSTGAAFRWIHTSVGSNYRMTEMQAAIGLRQLSKLPLWTEERRQRAAILFEALDGLPALRLTRPAEGVGHAFYKFYAFLNLEQLARGWSKDAILEEANKAGIPCQSGSCPEIYLEEAFDGVGPGAKTHLPNARALGRSSLLMPVDPTLTLEEVARMGHTLRKIIVAATA
ncbi:MAG: DegT/DnrJ/EryC1/StrS family aminotransferase [Pseudomonadota bacterium]